MEESEAINHINVDVEPKPGSAEAVVDRNLECGVRTSIIVSQ